MWRVLPTLLDANQNVHCLRIIDHLSLSALFCLYLAIYFLQKFTLYVNNLLSLLGNNF